MKFTASRGFVAAALLGLSAFAASADGFKPENPECIAPANPGGGVCSLATIFLCLSCIRDDDLGEAPEDAEPEQSALSVGDLT